MQYFSKKVFFRVPYMNFATYMVLVQLATLKSGLPISLQCINKVVRQDVCITKRFDGIQGYKSTDKCYYKKCLPAKQGAWTLLLKQSTYLLLACDNGPTHGCSFLLFPQVFLPEFIDDGADVQAHNVCPCRSKPGFSGSNNHVCKTFIWHPFP